MLKIRLPAFATMPLTIPLAAVRRHGQRAAGARCAGADPAILFLDEPTAGLRPDLRCRLDQLILTLQRALGRPCS
jgi:ABC-type thiamine transport system ATPase subunit